MSNYEVVTSATYFRALKQLGEEFLDVPDHVARAVRHTGNDVAIPTHRGAFASCSCSDGQYLNIELG